MPEPIVTFDEISAKITPEEYSAFCDRQRQDSLLAVGGDAAIENIRLDEMILRGVKILEDVLSLQF